MGRCRGRASERMLISEEEKGSEVTTSDEEIEGGMKRAEDQ